MTQSTQANGMAGQVSSLQTIIARLGTFIERETEQIETESNFDFGASSEKKSRLLFELNRLYFCCLVQVAESLGVGGVRWSPFQ